MALLESSASGVRRFWTHGSSGVSMRSAVKPDCRTADSWLTAESILTLETA